MKTLEKQRKVKTREAIPTNITALIDYVPSVGVNNKYLFLQFQQFIDKFSKTITISIIPFNH